MRETLVGTRAAAAPDGCCPHEETVAGTLLRAHASTLTRTRTHACTHARTDPHARCQREERPGTSVLALCPTVERVPPTGAAPLVRVCATLCLLRGWLVFAAANAVRTLGSHRQAMAHMPLPFAPSVRRGVMGILKESSTIDQVTKSSLNCTGCVVVP